MKEFMSLVKKNIKWVIAVIALLLFIIILGNIHKESIISFDNFYYDNISKLISNRMTFFVTIITNLGGAFALILLTILILLLSKNKRYGILTGINLSIIFLINVLLKFLFARPRPIDINLIEESGYSFPSGHAMVSTAFYGFLVFLIWNTDLSKPVKWLYSILLAILIILVCITRIYLGVHFASDVFGGALISIAYLVLFTSLVSKYLPNKNSSI